MKKTNAAYHLDVSNKRLLRAKQLAAEIIREIEDVSDPKTNLSAVYNSLLDVLYANGASWITDQDRAEMGLEPRDDKGWTPSERIKLEQDRSNAMFHASRIFMPLEYEIKNLLDISE